MVTARSRTGGSVLARTRPVLVLAFVLAAPLGAAPIATPTLSLGVRQPSDPVDLAGLAVTVAPATWWMVGGSTVALSAAWSGIPPGCAIAPQWYRWSIGPGGDEGLLSETNGSRTNFTGVEVEGGTTTVLVRSSATIDCDGTESGAFRTGASNLTIDAPLSVENLSVEPNPAEPTSTVSLNGTIVGGEPPYSVVVRWGEGNLTRTTAGRAGNFAAPASLGVGTFLPEVWVTDSEGLVARDTAGESLQVSAGFAVGVDPSTPETEVGERFGFSLRALNPPSNYSSLTSCTSDAPGGEPAFATVENLSCVFAQPGPATVSTVAVDADFPFTVATASLAEPVASPLAVGLSGALSPAEVGTTAYLPIAVSGGVPPFEISWSLVGNEGLQTTEVAADGTLLVPVVPRIAGTDQFTVGAVDSLGVATANSTASLLVLASMTANASLTGEPGADDAEANLSGSVLAGAPPFEWAVSPSRAAWNSSAPAGWLLEPGAFAWNATFRAEGNLTLDLYVVDALGSVWGATLSVVAIPSLSLTAAFAPAASGDLTVTGTIEGGLAPFELWLNDSGSTLWNGSVPTDGPVAIGTPVGDGGPATLTVLDRLGVSVSVVGSSHGRAPAPAPPTGAAALDLVIGLFVVGGGAATAVVLLRGRPPGTEPAGPDPVSTLRSILEPADGADRSVVELVAEEQGVPLETVRNVLDRLIADRTIRAERGPDGEEVLAWSRDR